MCIYIYNYIEREREREMSIARISWLHARYHQAPISAARRPTDFHHAHGLVAVILTGQRWPKGWEVVGHWGDGCFCWTVREVSRNYGYDMVFG